jgi:hypothetical protein
VAEDIYALVRQHFGEAVSPDLAERIRAGNHEDAFDFAQRYLDWVRADHPHIADKPRGQLRPFIRGEYFGPKGVSLFAPAFSRDDNQEALSTLYDGIVHHLLYCHAIALEDPLRHLVDSSGQLPLASIRNGMLGFRANPTTILSRYMRILVSLQPFIECGAVVIAEPIQTRWWGPTVGFDQESWAKSSRSYDLSYRELEMIEKLMSEELAESAKASLAAEGIGDVDDSDLSERSELLVRRGLAGVAHTARTAARVGDLDVYLRSNFERRLLAVSLEVSPGWLAGTAVPATPQSNRQLEILARLLSIDLPRLSGVGPNDIRTIRNDTTTFDRWRIALQSGLSLLGDVEDPTAEEARALRSEVADSIRQVGLDVDASINKSDVLSAAKGGMLSLAIGLLTGTGGLAHLAVGAGQKAASSLTGAALRKSRQHPLAKAIRRHTVLFEDADSSRE